jgi:LysR family transcriptional regulator, nitrogen assimilation regulatory protein
VDFQQLQTFACIHEHGNLSKAALALGAMPSVLSRQLAAFEQDCGGKLFHRTGRGMVLTELGARVLPRVASLLAEYHALVHEVSSEPGVISGQVRIGIVPSLAQAIAAPLFGELQRDHPRIQLQLLEGATGQLDAWRSQDLVDMTVLFRAAGSEPRNEDALGEVATYLLGPKGDSLTAAPIVSMVDLAGLPLVLAPLPNGLRADVHEAARKLRVPLNIVLETNSLAVQMELTAKGGAYTIVAGHALAWQLSAGLQASRLVDPAIVRTIAIGIASHRPATAATRLVARLARQHLAQAFKTVLPPAG